MRGRVHRRCTLRETISAGGVRQQQPDAPHVPARHRCVHGRRHGQHAPPSVDLLVGGPPPAAQTSLGLPTMAKTTQEAATTDASESMRRAPVAITASALAYAAAGPGTAALPPSLLPLKLDATAMRDRSLDSPPLVKFSDSSDCRLASQGHDLVAAATAVWPKGLFLVRCSVFTVVLTVATALLWYMQLRAFAVLELVHQSPGLDRLRANELHGRRRCAKGRRAPPGGRRGR